jgi:phage head maturation protease
MSMLISNSKESKIGQVKQKNQMHNLNLTYNVPFTELNQDVSDNFIIQGVAISATTTGNNHKFLPEELRMSAGSLKGVPLLLDHRNEAMNIRGRVIESGYDENNMNIPFAARVIDKEIQRMIKDGRINSVSVGAQVKEIDEEEGVLIPKGITFKELSLVAVPADPNATFNTALTEAWNSNTKIEEPVLHVESNSNLLKGGQMEETQEVSKVEKINEKEELESLKKQLAEYKAKERKTLEEKYVEACKEKNVKSIDVKSLNDLALNALIEQVNSIVIEKVEVKPTIKEVEVEKVLEGKRKIVEGRGSLRGGAFWIE